MSSLLMMRIRTRMYPLLRPSIPQRRLAAAIGEPHPASFCGIMCTVAAAAFAGVRGAPTFPSANFRSPARGKGNKPVPVPDCHVSIGVPGDS